MHIAQINTISDFPKMENKKKKSIIFAKNILFNTTL